MRPPVRPTRRQAAVGRADARVPHRRRAARRATGDRASRRRADPTLAMAPPQALAALATRVLGRSTSQAHPLQATEIGDRRFDDRLPDPTPAARDREIAALTALRARVAALPVAALSAGDRVTRALLLGEIDAGLAFGSCALDDWAVDARDGTQVAFMRLPELQPVRTVAEGWKFVARLGEDGRLHRSGDRQPAARAGGREGRDRRGDRARAGPARRSAGEARRQVAAARAGRGAARGLAGARAAGVHARDRRRDRRRHPPGLRAPARRAPRRDPAARARRGARRHPERRRAARPATRS